MPRSTDPLAQLLEGIARELPRAVELRHRLHAEPELAHAETKTAASIAAELPVSSTTVAGTGLAALISDSAAAPVAVRAELDGLPIRERTSSTFSARGEAMHACGHDVHMAALVALSRAAHALADALPAPLLAIFQPSEEAYPSGAEALARGGLADFAPRAVVGAHVHPELPWGTVGLDTGVVNASCDLIEIVIEGEPTHGAYPHHGRDPVLALAEVVVSLHAQLSRRIDPLHPAVLTIGELQAGSAENVIPAEARARGALRAYRPEDRRALAEMVEQVVAGVAAAYGCRGAVTLAGGEPALCNDAQIVARARALLSEAGLDAAPHWRSCGSDDFAFFGELAPLAMSFVGLDGAPGFKRRPLHHPELLIPDEAIAAVARVQAILFLAAAEADALPAG